MKKILYGTTALVASGMMAGAALAADPISLKINGFYDATLVIHDDDAAGTGDSAVKQDVEININGSTVLDSGVTVGAQIEFKEPVGGSGLGNEEKRITDQPRLCRRDARSRRSRLRCAVPFWKEPRRFWSAARFCG